MSQMPTGGFRASLTDTSLFDLVQIECTRRAHGAARVDSKGRRGYLFFDGGEIIHARTGSLVGEPALFEMLSWPSGIITPADVAWPARPTLRDGWQHLLLRAAQAMDETPSPTTGIREAEVIRITARGPDHHRSVVHMTSPAATAEDAMEGYDLDWSERTDVFDLAELARDGSCRNTKGAADDLAPLGAYILQIAARIGGELGLDDFDYLVARTRDSQTVVIRERDGAIAFRCDPKSDVESALRGRHG